MWEWHTTHLARMPCEARWTRRPEDGFFFRRSGFFSTKRKNAAAAAARSVAKTHRDRSLPSVKKNPHRFCGVRRAVTTATTLEKGIRALESASPAAPFDVALLEEKQAEPLFLAAAPSAGGGAASKDLPAGVAGSAQLALGARFAKLASECAIVLMHEEEDVGNKAYMIEAIRVGVVDVVRFPLVAQSMRTLWQHAVRRMIRVAARKTRRSEYERTRERRW